MKIIKIGVYDFLGLAAFKTDRLGKLNKITGDNGVGKSSVLKAIKEAFRSSGVDPDLIRLHGDKAEIMIELDREILIKRKITPSDNSVTVTVGGQPMNSPQMWLKALLGPFNFDPTDFFLSNGKERRQRLLSAIPFTITPKIILDILGEYSVEMEPMWETPQDFQKATDFSQHGLIVIQQIGGLVYDRRREVNLDCTRQKKAIEQERIDLGDTKDLDRFKGFDVEKSVEELSRQREANQEHDRDEKEIESLRQQAVDKKSEIERLRNQIIILEEGVAEINEQGKALVAKGKKFQPYETESLQTKISEFYHFQKVLNRLEDIKRHEGQLELSQDTHKSLDDLHKALVGDVPKRLLEKIELPIDGLEIKGDKIMVKGVALDKMSTSEQMTFSIRLARSLAGELKVICIDRFESLGAEARKAFEKEVGKDEFEYFITVVTEGPLAMESVDGPTSGTVVEPDKKPAPKKKAGTTGADF